MIYDFNIKLHYVDYIKHICVISLDAIKPHITNEEEEYFSINDEAIPCYESFNFSEVTRVIPLKENEHGLAKTMLKIGKTEIKNKEDYTYFNRMEIITYTAYVKETPEEIYALLKEKVRSHLTSFRKLLNVKES